MTLRTPILLLLLCTAPLLLSAQKDVIWQNYGIGMILPSTTGITRQDAHIFTAKGETMQIQIQPWNGETIVPDDGKDALAGYARDLGYRDIQQAQEDPLSGPFGIHD